MTHWHCHACGAVTDWPDFKPTPGFGAILNIAPGDCCEGEGVNVCPVCGSDDFEMITREAVRA